MNEVHDCYYGSNGDRTKALYDRLKAIGPAGVVAVNLLRASKNSERARLIAGETGKSVAKDFGVTPANISQIRLRQTWPHI